MSQTAKALIVAVVLLVLLIGIPHSTSFVMLLATRALVFAILALSVDLLLGFAGLGSLGQPAQVRVGA
jgi:branched-chain amino acid transport system permease protein